MTRPRPDVLLLETDLPTAEDTRHAGRLLGGILRAGDVLVLVGDLGAGKTTLTQGLAEGLGVRGPITSPTFVISRVHPSSSDGPALVHVDAYRLGGAAELEDLDLDATVDTSVTVVEWGAGTAEQLSDSYLVVDLVRGRGLDGATEDGTTGDAAADAVGTDADMEDALSDEHDDPRRIRIVGVGPRWAEQARLQL